MSEITRGVLRMPPELWGDDPLSVAHRHARYVDAADTIDRLQAECDALRADAERWRYVRRKVCFSGIGNGKAHMYIINLPISETFPEIGQHEVCADAAIDAALEAGK